MFVIKLKNLLITMFCTTTLVLFCSFIILNNKTIQATTTETSNDYIKWVDFNVTYSALEKAMNLDIKSHNLEDGVKYNWIEILAYLSCKYGGNFSRYKASDIDDFVKKIDSGKTIDELTENMEYYSFYIEAYTAVLGEFVGEYKVQTLDSNNNLVWQEKYGLKVFFPLASGYYYNHYDDFGAGRNYGYKRTHLGHDLMANIGTPVISIESGVVEELGWNQYGGWRIGIRSFDTKRYYYYAHLRKDYPYVESLKIGDTVKAGDVIGYVGRTGYSTTPNTNNIDKNHLHFGMQLIFDKSQEDGPNEIWIDLYSLSMLLAKNKSKVEKIENTKEYKRVYDFFESSLSE